MTKFRFLALFAALALLLTVSTTVLAQGAPKQPHVFTGSVMVGDEMAMEGTEVTAMIDGETVGMAMVMDGTYIIKIEDPDDGDYTGMTVMFMVGMEDVEQSGEWMEGMVSPLNLMAMAMEPEPTMEPVVGATGPRGVSGQKGDDGDPGATGPEGKQGRQGLQGPKGSDGTDGENGTNGRNGSDGSNGSDGVDGSNGTDGRNGSNGAAGADGTNGTNGADGAAGATGAKGGGGVLGIIGFILAIVALVAAGGVYAMSRRG